MLYNCYYVMTTLRVSYCDVALYRNVTSGNKIWCYRQSCKFLPDVCVFVSVCEHFGCVPVSVYSCVFVCPCARVCVSVSVCVPTCLCAHISCVHVHICVYLLVCVYYFSFSVYTQALFLKQGCSYAQMKG